MSLPSTQDIQTILLNSFRGIVVFNDVNAMLAFKISDLITQLGRNDSADWHAPIVAFTQRIIIDFYRRGYELLDFDSNWFDKNKDKTVKDLVDYLHLNCVEF